MEKYDKVQFALKQMRKKGLKAKERADIVGTRVSSLMIFENELEAVSLYKIEYMYDRLLKQKWI